MACILRYHCVHYTTLSQLLLSGQDYAAVSRWGEWDDSYGNDWNRPYACQCNPHGVASMSISDVPETFNSLKYLNFESKYVFWMPAFDFTFCYEVEI